MAFPLSSQIFTSGNAASFSNAVSAGTLSGNGGQIANITGANVTGAVGSATTAATVTTAAQPNITSVGTLTSLSVTGNVSGGNIISAGTFQAATITSSSIAIPYTNTVPYTANVITLNGNTLWRSNGNVAANIPFAVGNTANTWSMVQQWTKTSNAWFVDPVNGLDTNDGSQVSPFQTIARALVLAGGAGRTVFLYPGTYTETLTITNANLNLAGITLGSGILLSGNITVNLTGSPTSSIRSTGVRYSNLTMTGTGGSLFLDACQVDNLTHTGTGYVEMVDCESEVGNVTVTAAGAFAAFQGNLRRLTLANSTAQATIHDAIFTGANIIVTAGTMLLNNCIITAPTANANVITSSAGTAVYVNYSGMTTTTGAGARVSIGGFYSFTGTIVDTANSVLGTNLNSTQTTDSLNVLNLANVASMVSRSTIVATGNITTAAGNVSGGNLLTGGRVVATGNLVTSAQVVATGNVVTSAEVVATGNVSGGNIVTGGRMVATGNVVTSAQVVATGNVTGNFFIGNGSQLSNITGANVTGEVLVANTVSNPSQPNITALGTITSLSAGAVTITGELTANGNAQFNGDVLFSGNVTIPGNINQISGNSGQFFGNAVTGFGALYAGLPAGYTLLAQEVMQYATSFNGYTQVSMQNINGGNQASGDFIVTADNGNDTTNYVDLGMAGSGYNGAAANNSLGTSLLPNDGYLYTRGNVTGGNLVLGSNQANGVVRIIANGQSNLADVVATFSAAGLTIANTVLAAQVGNSATYLYGNGSNISNITGANVTGTVSTANTAFSVAGANVVGTVGSATNANSSAFANTAFSVDGANVVGTVSSATTAGTVTTAAQPNITSVGTLTSLSVTGNVSAAFYTGNGSQLTGMYSNTQVSDYLASGTATANINTTGNVIAGNLVTGGSLTVSSLASSSISIPYSNVAAIPANVIVQYGNSLLRTNGVVAAGATFAYGNVGTANTFSYVSQWTNPTKNVYIDPDNGNDAWDGSINTPFQTMATALARRANLGITFNLLPGTYTESITITDQNCNINGPGFGRGVNITGTWTFDHPASSIRVYGCGFTDLVFSGAGSLYLNSCQTTNVTVSGPGFFDVINSSLAEGPVQLNPGNATTQYTNIDNSTFNDMVINGNTTVTINNSQADNCNVVIDLGTLIIYNSSMISEAPGNTVLTASNVTNVIINGSTFADSDGTSGVIDIAGGYSFGGVNYDAGNSTITGTSFGDFQYFDNISVITYLRAAALIETRVVPRINFTASAATITINANTTDQYDVLALATGATFAAPTGTLTDGQKLTIRIRDNGGAQTLAWNAIFRVIGTTLPTTTVAGKLVYVGCIYNQLDTKWDVVSVAQEA